jgi:hypothetical protein
MERTRPRSSGCIGRIFMLILTARLYPDGAFVSDRFAGLLITS